MRLNEIWNKRYEALRRFRDEHGHCRPPYDYCKPGIALANWCDSQRQDRKLGKLSADRVKKLEALGFEWQPVRDYWKRGFSLLASFRNKHPDRWPRAIDVLPNGFKLGSWCAVQRKRWKQGIIPLDEKRKLDAIGFEWEPEEALWKRAFWLLRLYRRDNPKRWPPASYVTAGGFRLGAWCRNKRTAIKRGVLTRDHLKQLREIGFE